MKTNMIHYSMIIGLLNKKAKRKYVNENLSELPISQKLETVYREH